ncbi:ubiquitin-conjugating enzyme/RWD-like protein [Aspergillus venezuelensis]
MPLLPPEILESQISTIDLLSAMFPEESELDLDPSTTECMDKLRAWCEDPSGNPPSGIPSSILLAVHAPINESDKKIQLNISFSLHASDEELVTHEAPPMTYSLRQPDFLSKADVAGLSSSMPRGDILAALEYIQEEAANLLDTPVKEPTSQLTTDDSSTNDPLVRVWFYFPSLSTREKRNDMVNYGPDYGLTGFVLAGKPGVLCLEGTSRNIDAYMGFIKTHSWGDIPRHQKKVSERYRETEGVERIFGGMEEITDSLGERGGQRANRGDMQALEAWLAARGLHGAFEKVIF